MATTVAKLAGDLSLSSASWETGLANATRALNTNKSSWDSTLKSASKSFGGLRESVNANTAEFLGLKGEIAGLLSGAGLVAITKQALDSADAIGKLSDKLGLSTTATQQYLYAAQQAGVSSETFEKVIERLNTNIAAGKLPYKDTGTAILDISNKVAGATTNIQRAQIVNEAFGSKLGSQLIPFLQLGADGIKAFGAEAQQLGIVLDETTIRQAEEFKESLDSLGTVITKNFQAGFLGGFVDQVGQVRDLFEDKNFTDGIKNVGAALGDLVAFILTHLPQATTVMATFAGAAAGAVAGGAVGSVVPVLGTGVGALGGAIVGGTQGFARAGLKTGIFDGTAYGDLNGRPQPGAPNPNDPLNLNQFLKPQKPKSNGNTDVATNYATQQKSDADAQKSADDLLNSLDAENSKLTTQIALYGDKSGASDRMQKQIQIENQLSKDGVELGDDDQARLDAELDSYGKLQAQLKDIAEDEKIRQQAIAGFTSALSNGFEDAILQGGKLSTVISNLATQLAQVALKAAIFAPLQNFLNDGIGSFFAAHFANGGTPPIGQLSVVGERGPELIAPKGASTVIPLSQLGGGGDAPTFVANITVQNQGGNTDANQAAALGASLTKQLDVWFDTKLQNSARVGNQLNPIF